jgi:SAM-dependent methyltransferase
MSDELGAAFWDERYRSKGSLWSGKPNMYLLQETAGLTPGSALDVGCGEGADAIWLARRGWQVTAVDISGVALQRAAGHARQDGDHIAARITWIRHDLTTWSPSPHHYDLVTAQYLQLPSAIRSAVFGRLTAAVSPGGTLLIVGHHISDLQTTVRRPPDPDRYFTGDEIAAWLAPGRWLIVSNVEPERAATDQEGGAVTVRDVVFRASRPGSSAAS